MASIHTITSTDNPKVKAAAKLRESKYRRATGLFVVESMRELERAVAADLTVQQLFVCREKLAESLPDIAGADIYDIPEPVLRKLAYRENPTGLVAVIEQPSWSLDSIQWRDESVVLIAQGLAKPGNLGAMARTAAAAGCAGMIVVDAVVDPFNPNAIRASTGAVFSLPIVCASSEDCRAMLEREQVNRYAAALSPDAIDHTRVDYTGKAAIIIGAEDVGLADDWIAFCKQRGHVIQIPMAAGAIDSLNASVAAGVLLFEVWRQRRADKK